MVANLEQIYHHTPVLRHVLHSLRKLLPAVAFCAEKTFGRETRVVHPQRYLRRMFE